MFTSVPLEEHLRSYYEDTLDQIAGTKEALNRAPDALTRAGLLKSLRSLQEIVGLAQSTVEDPLSAFWKAQIERGEEPDLDLSLEDLKALGYV
jgi:hypothetical protein